LGLRGSTAVFSGTADTQAASVAAGAFRFDQGGINIGSTAQILARARGKKTDAARDLLTMPSPIRADWLVLAENGIAGKALDLLLRQVVFARDNLADHSSTRPFERLECALRATRPGSNGLLFFPWFTGCEAPEPNDRIRGAFINLSVTTNREVMIRAVLEGIALSLRWLRNAVESFRAQTIRHLRFCGGGARSDGWAQILADVMRQPVDQLKGPEFTGCRAAAFLAFEQLSLVDLAEHPDFFPVRKRFEPRSTHRDVYDRNYENFLLGVRCNAPVFEALNA
jgi:xylulokinase